MSVLTGCQIINCVKVFSYIGVNYFYPSDCWRQMISVSPMQNFILVWTSRYVRVRFNEILLYKKSEWKHGMKIIVNSIFWLLKQVNFEEETFLHLDVLDKSCKFVSDINIDYVFKDWCSTKFGEVIRNHNKRLQNVLRKPFQLFTDYHKIIMHSWNIIQ